VGCIDLTQLAVATYLFSIGESTYATALLALIAPQMALQYKYLIPDPVANDVK
jgi:chlorophyll synthase